MLATLLHNAAFVVGSALTSLAVGGKAPLIVGILLIVLGLLYR